MGDDLTDVQRGVRYGKYLISEYLPLPTREEVMEFCPNFLSVSSNRIREARSVWIREYYCGILSAFNEVNLKKEEETSSNSD